MLLPGRRASIFAANATAFFKDVARPRDFAASKYEESPPKRQSYSSSVKGSYKHRFLLVWAQRQKWPNENKISHRANHEGAGEQENLDLPQSRGWLHRFVRWMWSNKKKKEQARKGSIKTYRSRSLHASRQVGSLRRDPPGSMAKTSKPGSAAFICQRRSGESIRMHLGSGRGNTCFPLHGWQWIPAPPSGGGTTWMKMCCNLQ